MSTNILVSQAMTTPARIAFSDSRCMVLVAWVWLARLPTYIRVQACGKLGGSGGMLPWGNFDFGPFIIETVFRILVCHTTKLIIGIPMIHYVVILVPIGGNFPHLATTAPHLHAAANSGTCQVCKCTKCKTLSCSLHNIVLAS